MLDKLLVFIIGLGIGHKCGTIFEVFFYKIFQRLKNGFSRKKTYENDEMKLVLCVRMDLKMGKGKIASQCSHAAIGAYSDCLPKNSKYFEKWLSEGQRKIVVKIPDYSAMINVYKLARSNDINAHIVSDAGRTQLPNGSKTVIAVGPGPAQLIDKITGDFTLL